MDYCAASFYIILVIFIIAVLGFIFSMVAISEVSSKASSAISQIQPQVATQAPVQQFAVNAYGSPYY